MNHQSEADKKRDEDIKARLLAERAPGIQEKRTNVLKRMDSMSAEEENKLIAELDKDDLAYYFLTARVDGHPVKMKVRHESGFNTVWRLTKIDGKKLFFDFRRDPYITINPEVADPYFEIVYNQGRVLAFVHHRRVEKLENAGKDIDDISPNDLFLEKRPYLYFARADATYPDRLLEEILKQDSMREEEDEMKNANIEGELAEDVKNLAKGGSRKSRHRTKAVATRRRVRR